MQFVSSGVNLPFQVTYDSPTLFVAMLIYDVTSMVPLLIVGPSAMDNVVGNTYVGYFTASAGKSYVINKAVYTDGTFTTLHPDYSQGSDSIQAGGVDLSYVVPSLGLTSAGFAELPDVSSALFNWLQPMVFTVITKTVVNFKVKELPTLYNFQGVWQPFTPEQLKLKPEGQRSWDWYMLHAHPSLILKPDEIVAYLAVQYRVMMKSDYTKYGYVQYELVRDWIGSGP